MFAPLFQLILLALLRKATGSAHATATTSSLTQLNHTVDGRLYDGIPLSAPCFSVANGHKVIPDADACQTVQQRYHDTVFRASQFGSAMMAEWESCQAESESCQLDSLNASNPAAYAGGRTCSQGSVPPYYIDVRKASDIQAAFEFSKGTGMHLSIKNSGHDYKGRSTSAGSLGLWVHNLNTDVLVHNSSFVPNGCPNLAGSYNAMTVGAGIDFQTIYQFADANNVTFVGGYHQTVVAGGGWVQGGGYSVLTPVYGLGIDHVLEFKIVTPDGRLRVANACQNEDLFWALRGGGGGTFGVVLESTHLVEKQISLTVVSVAFNQTADNVPGFMKLLVDNSLKWAQEGWGGHVPTTTSLIYVNPLLTVDEAKESFKDVGNYTLSQGGIVVIEELPSWYAFFKKYTLTHESPVGYELILSSRLIPSSVFTNTTSRDALLKLLVDTLPISTPSINLGTPTRYTNYTKGSTSSTPAWRDATWQLVFHAVLGYNDSVADTKPSTRLQNEGDVYEPDYQTSYWGDNYPTLLAIKSKYDPHGLLDCWQCVGTRGTQDPRFKCYV